MNARAIPDNEQLAGEVPEQMLQEAHDLDTADRPLMYLHQQLAGGRNATDHRQVVIAAWHPQDGGVPGGRIRPHARRQEVEGRLVYEYQRALL